MWWTCWHRLTLSLLRLRITNQYASLHRNDFRFRPRSSSVRALIRYGYYFNASHRPWSNTTPPIAILLDSSHRPRFCRQPSAHSPLHLRNRLPPRPQTRQIYCLVVDHRIDFLQKQAEKLSIVQFLPSGPLLRITRGLHLRFSCRTPNSFYD